MSKEYNKLQVVMLLDSAITIEKNIEELQSHPYWKQIKDFIIQDLSQPTKEELRKSIIERLNRLYELPYGEDSFEYDKENKVFKWWAFKDCEYQYGYAKEDDYIYIEGLPLQLAHDITRYFLMEANNNE